MDLRDDIKKVASLTGVDDDAKFYRLQGLSQAAKDRKMNERKVRKPRNLNILEDSDTDSDDMDIIGSKVKPTFDRYEISAAVREVNGGRDLSNKHWEDMLAKNLEVMTTSEKETSQNCSKRDIKTNQETKDLNVDNKCIKDRLFRNAAIMGLVKTKKITLQDLINSNENTTNNESETSHGTTFNKCVTDDKCQVESVPLREDPEIFVHPLLAEDKKKFKDKDFVVPRIGKRKTVTPTQYFLDETKESHFEFVKKKDSNKYRK